MLVDTTMSDSIDLCALRKNLQGKQLLRMRPARSARSPAWGAERVWMKPNRGGVRGSSGG
jgi:hypothetical protein